MLRVLTAAPVLAVVALAGCGGSSSSSQTASRTTAGAGTTNCPTAQGVASGEALVGAYTTAKYKVPFILAQNFKVWVSGRAAGNEPGAPSQPLCPQERQAAAAVVLDYAAKHSAELSANATPSAGGKNLLGYLRSQGVVCGSQCGIQPGTQGAAAASAAATSVRAIDKRTDANSKACSAALGATTRLADDVHAALKNSPTVTTAGLNDDITRVTSYLGALRTQANASKGAQLESDISALGTMKADGTSVNTAAIAISIGFQAAPLKQLPDLLSQIC